MRQLKVIEQIQAASDKLGTSCLIFSLLLFRLSKVFATVQSHISIWSCWFHFSSNSDPCEYNQTSPDFIKSNLCHNSCPIFIDLKGMLVRTLVKNKPIKLAPGKTVYIGDDPSMAGKHDNLIVIDSRKFAAKLRRGDKITFNYVKSSWW